MTRVELPVNLAAQILRPDEIAAYLRVNRSTVYRLLNDGRLPGFRVGRRDWRLRRDELEKLGRGKIDG